MDHDTRVVSEDPSLLVLLEGAFNLGGAHTEEVSPVVKEGTYGADEEDAEANALQEHEEPAKVRDVIECDV